MRIVLILFALFLLRAPVEAQCLIGLAVVPCATPPLRTVAVTTSAEFAAALLGARPGDAITLARGLVVDGTVWTAVPGTATAPIVITGGHIRPGRRNSGDAVNINHAWYILRNVEVSHGWHGVQVNAPHVLLEDVRIHDTGTAAGGGQGVLVLHSDVAVVRLTQMRAGALSKSPKLVHGLYVSDYYQRGIARVTLLNSTFTENGGAGLHVWNATAKVRDLRVEGSTFTRNAIGLVLTNVEGAVLSGNTVTYNGTPPTDYGVRTWLRLELSRGVRVVGNRFGATLAPCAGLVSWHDQPRAEVWFSSNLYQWPSGGCRTLGDAEWNRAAGR